GVNYLIPVNEDIQEEDEIKFKAVDTNFVLSKMDSAGNQMNVMILDACRDNPFKRSFRSSARGLVQMDAPRGSLIVYATSPGKTAADGEGRNGIFTKHLLKAIRETDLEVGQLLREVRRGVMNETNSNQIPWESSSLTGDFYFSSQFKPAEHVEAGGTKLPPKPAELTGVDISSIKKAAKEKERIKSKWDNWQTGMKSDFMEVEKLDKSTAYTDQEIEIAWQQFLDNYKTDNPYSSEDELLRQKAAQRIRWIQARGSLRSSAQSLSWNEGFSMVKRKNFFDSSKNKSGDFKNEYESKTTNGDKVVLDYATGLIWHQSGSEVNMKYGKAKQWVDELNRMGYAGYSDWRLPTLEEGASLIERSKMSGNLYIDPLFSAKQRWIWTSDTVTDSSGRMWIVFFSGGNVIGSPISSSSYVRPVRSGR
ncbi:MAG: DUF1566 domain-containing protein, partial [Candidatus Aminicenantaceae bacterium]